MEPLDLLFDDYFHLLAERPARPGAIGRLEDKIIDRLVNAREDRRLFMGQWAQVVVRMGATDFYRRAFLALARAAAN